MSGRRGGLFVTGTDTGVGKTVVSGAVAAALAGQGLAVAAYKPVLTGLDESPQPGWPHDDELLGRAAGRRTVVPHRFGPPASPHLAAELAGVAIGFDALVDAAARAGEGADVLVAEGVGGLLVPLTPERTVRDLAVVLGMPLLVAARPGLGTINHTLLTLEAARAAGLRVAAVVLTPWPEQPSVVELSNRSTIERLGGVEVAVLPRLPSSEPDVLRRAGEDLRPLRWL